MCILSDELINDFEQEYRFVICQGLRFKVEQDWLLLVANQQNVIICNFTFSP